MRVEAHSSHRLTRFREPLVVATGVVLLLVAAGVVQDLVIAARPTSPVPDGASSNPGWLLDSIALLALLGGGVVLTMAAFGSSARDALARAWWLHALVSAAAVALVLAFDLGYDTYYGDAAVRYVDFGPVGPAWLAVLAGIAIVVVAVARLRPRIGLQLEGAFLWLCALSALFTMGGH